MPGIKSEFASNTDYLTPFELYAENINSNQTVAGVTSRIDLRDSVSALNNVMVIVLTGAAAATATVSVYVNPASGSLGTNYILLGSKATQKTGELIKFEGLYAGTYKIVIADITNGPLSVHVSYSDLRGQYVLPDLV